MKEVGERGGEMEKGDDEGEKGKGELELKWDRHYCKGEVEARKGEEKSTVEVGRGRVKGTRE